MYAQPEVDMDRTKVWLRSGVSIAERKLRLLVKRPLEREMPDGSNHGLEFRCQRLDHIRGLIDQAGKILPADAPVLEAGQRRLDSIRRLPLIPASEEARLKKELEEENEKAKRREDEEAAVAAAEQEALRQKQSRRAVPQFAKFCDCGYRFLEDAMSCRKCGGARKEVESTRPDDDDMDLTRLDEDGIRAIAASSTS